LLSLKKTEERYNKSDEIMKSHKTNKQADNGAQTQFVLGGCGVFQNKLEKQVSVMTQEELTLPVFRDMD